MSHPASVSDAAEQKESAPIASGGTGRNLAWQPMLLSVAVAVAVAVNLWWVSAYRKGLPLDIDEAGYLQRAVRDADTIHAGGLTALWSTARLPDPQAPLVTVTAGLLRWTSGGGSYRLFAVEQIFYVVAVFAAYWAARRLMSPNWSLLTALLVASVPGVVNSSRAFWFALPAAAMVTATLAAQMHADAFRSRWLSLLWGLLLGLSALTRSMVLALLPLLILAAVMSVVLSRSSRRVRALNLGLGLAVFLVVAGSWYSATWHPVLEYLTRYGYGGNATHYGTRRSVLSVGWWLFRTNDVANTELYAPLALALGLCFLAGLQRWRPLRRDRRAAPPHPVGTVTRAVTRFFRRPDASAWTLVAGGYLVLSSSPNQGALFELPIVPALCVLAVAAARRSQTLVRPFLAGICFAAAVVSFAGVSTAIPALSSSARTLSTGPVNLVVFDGRGTISRYVAVKGSTCADSRCGAGTSAQNEDSYLRRWVATSQAMAAFLHDFAEARSCRPVVFFGVQDPLFNTNSVDLDFQLAFHHSLPTGLLQNRRQGGESPAEQLQDPTRGMPNLVITGPVPRGDPGFSPLAGQRRETLALRRSGFSPVAHLRLPDGRAMAVWWDRRGACGQGGA